MIAEKVPDTPVAVKRILTTQKNDIVKNFWGYYYGFYFAYFGDEVRQ